MFTAGVQDCDHDKIIRKHWNMYMSVIQRSTWHCLFWRHCHAWASNEHHKSCTLAAVNISLGNPTSLPHSFAIINLPKNSQPIGYSTLYFLSVFLLSESPSAAGGSSRTTAIIRSIRTANTLSNGSIKPRCIHLGIVVRACENPSFCRM